MEEPKPLTLRQIRDLLNSIKRDEILDQPSIFLFGENDPVYSEIYVGRLPESWIYNNDIEVGLPMKEFKKLEDYDPEERREKIAESVVLPKGSLVFSGFVPPPWSRIKSIKKPN